ncbi:S-layer homology domain-containing protein [Ureibacillus sp. FSL W8-0352]|uniref:S-layer homology domain-containing protein n=1 Tax=Ureibacillus sp. FSL W8-0352 TaxID=2954596 RepID=UPI00404788CA
MVQFLLHASKTTRYSCCEQTKSTLETWDSSNDVSKSVYRTNSSERDAIQWLYDNEITTGVDPSKPKNYDNFNPNGHMTRAQAITFMYRLYEKDIIPQK